MNSSELKGYLTGLIIGDGYLDKGIRKRAFVIKSTNEDFITKIAKDISSCSTFKIFISTNPEYIDKSNVHHKQCYELRIKAHPYFNKIYNHFYDDERHRRVSSDALNWLTPNGIANWYMSDGYICCVGKMKNNIYSRRVELATDRYKKQEIEKMQKMFLSKFGIKTSIIKRQKFFRLRILNESYNEFIELIEPYIVESMRYKLNLEYNHRMKWMSDKMWNIQLSLMSATAQTDKAVG